MRRWEVLGLYRRVLRAGEALEWTSRELYRRRLRSEWRDGRLLQGRDAEVALAKAQALLSNSRLL